MLTSAGEPTAGPIKYLELDTVLEILPLFRRLFEELLELLAVLAFLDSILLVLALLRQLLGVLAFLGVFDAIFGVLAVLDRRLQAHADRGGHRRSGCGDRADRHRRVLPGVRFGIGCRRSRERRVAG